jgi:hypothetical protein
MWRASQRWWGRAPAIAALLLGVLGWLAASGPAEARRFEIVAGWSGADGQSYSFISPQLSFPADTTDEWVLRGTLSYLTYDFVDAAGGRASVSSPGVALGVAYRWRRERTTVTVGPGWEVRQVRTHHGDGRRTESTDHGWTLHGDGHHRATDAVSLGLGAGYHSVNEWLAVSGVTRYHLRQDGGPPAVGVELITQGNPDLRATGAGGLLELPAGTATLQIRAGQMRLRHASGLEETRPYYNVGVVARF